ncbi:hypothetical protein BBJ28_00025167, partial [Nothophytophthora sp. Chile5]
QFVKLVQWSAAVLPAHERLREGLLQQLGLDLVQPLATQLQVLPLDPPLPLLQDAGDRLLHVQLQQRARLHQNQADAAVAVPMRSADARKLTRGRRTRWNNDGPSEEVSSLSVLLDWLTTEGNYSKWRGDDNNSRETKTILAGQISAQIQRNGITTVRKAKDIVSKISQLEQSFRVAVDFLRNTGAEITDEASLQEAIEKRCLHYETLKEVMSDRPSSASLVNAGRPKRRRTNVAASVRQQTTRPLSPSVTSTISEWSDLNATLARSKALEREGAMVIHTEKMAFKRQQLRQTTQFEERRISCIEEESKCRIVLLVAQAKKEVAQAKREEDFFGQPFELEDPSKPGVRKILAFFLVDPENPVPSTSVIPPQQQEWLEMTQQPLMKKLKLVETVEDTVRSMLGSGMSLEEAKEYRLKLMTERAAVDDDHVTDMER